MAKSDAGSVNVRSDVRRVLVYRMGSLGDTVVALPALHLIAKAFPNAERRMLTNFPVSVKAPAAKAILGENGLIHGYFRYVVGTRSVKELAALWWMLRRWRPEVLVYLGPRRGVAAAKRDATFFRLCGIAEQIGVPLTEAMQENAFQGDWGALEPECERLVRNICELGDINIEGREAWNLLLTDREAAKADKVLEGAAGRPILAVSVGTKWQSKDWGLANWTDLLRRLGMAHPDYVLVLTGAEEERGASDRASAGWRDGAGEAALILNLCGSLTPRETASVFRRARLFVGHDSGPMHLAAAVGTRCVAIFAAVNLPRVWFPVGPGHSVIYHRVSCAGCGLEVCEIEKKRCMSSISVDEVAEEVEASVSTLAGESRLVDRQAKT